MAAEGVGNSGVISSAPSPAEHVLGQLPTTDSGDHIDIACHHHNPSGNRYLLAGHAIRQALSVPVLELITNSAHQRGSNPQLGGKHARLVRPRCHHSGDDSHPFAGRQASAEVPHHVRHQLWGLAADHRCHDSANSHLIASAARCVLIGVGVAAHESE